MVDGEATGEDEDEDEDDEVLLFVSSKHKGRCMLPKPDEDE